MESIRKIISSDDNEIRKPRATIEQEEEISKKRMTYSTVFHHLTRILNLDTSLKITLMANIEGLSRAPYCCVMNYDELAVISGCSREELERTLESLNKAGLIEEGKDNLKRHGWKLAERVRSLVEPIRKDLTRNRAKRYSSKA